MTKRKNRPTLKGVGKIAQNNDFAEENCVTREIELPWGANCSEEQVQGHERQIVLNISRKQDTFIDYMSGEYNLSYAETFRILFDRAFDLVMKYQDVKNSFNDLSQFVEQ